MNSKLFSVPVPGSNAAAIGTIGVLGLCGLVLGQTPRVRLVLLAFSLTLLTGACLISDTEFGRADLSESVSGIFNKLYTSYYASPEQGLPSRS